VGAVISAIAKRTVLVHVICVVLKNGDKMERVEFQEAVKLCEECIAFSNGALVGNDSPLREKARKMFGQSTVSHMLYVCTMVFYEFALEYKENHL